MAYATKSQVKTYLNIEEAGDDDLIDDLIDRAQVAIESYTGWLFEAITRTRYFDSDAVIDSMLWTGGDLISITTLTNADDDATVISSSDYRLLPRNAGPPYFGVKMLVDTTTTWDFDIDGEVSILGTWGYSTSPPDDIVHACIRLAAFFYRAKDAQTYDTIAVPDAGIITIPKGIPADVKLILDKYPRWVS